MTGGATIGGAMLGTLRECCSAMINSPLEAVNVSVQLTLSDEDGRFCY
jgi:hypothetical protein